jgi:DNA polymerase-1
MSDKKPTILIVDGDGLLTRAHFAMGGEYLRKEIINGELATYEIGGVHKSIQVIQRQMEFWSADALLVAFDPTGSKTFRHRLYAEYKAGRQPKPLGLVKSKEILISTLRLMGDTIVHATDVEADDILATAAKLAGVSGWRAIISSHDKDLMVLAEDAHVVIAPPFQADPMTDASILEKFGVYPGQITDYLSLLGDVADNIPGVDGCGHKTAGTYLKKYSTLEKIVAAALSGEITKKLGDSFRAQGKRALAFRDLMNLKKDVPGVPDPFECKGNTPDFEKLALFLEDLEFYDFAKQARAELADCALSF